MHKAALGLGSDLGDRLANLRRAAAKIDGSGSCRVIKSSGVYETVPWGVDGIPHFLNACVQIETVLSPRSLLTLMKNIEEDLGRVKSGHWAARTIDIDILLYDVVSIYEDGLIIPHHFMDERAFVLVPLMDICPNDIHARSGLTIRELCAELSAESIEGTMRIVGL